MTHHVVQMVDALQHDLVKRASELLMLCMYRPDEDKARSLVQQAALGDPYRLWLHLDGATPDGIIIVRLSTEEAEITHIAVDKARRARGDGTGQGIGRCLVEHAATELAGRTLVAGTDSDAVGFYRKCGFHVVALGQKYPGTDRFRCTRAAR